MNSLVDIDIIKKLYDASNAGVKIRLIIRGICSLVPGIKNSSENIEIISIIDRFLEHARIYIFANDGKEKVYLASADWMSRNLMNRVECGFPVYDEEAKKVVKDIIELQWNDPLKARKIDGINDTLLVQKGNAYQGIGSQQATYNYLKNLI
jgi:polyphosphate kinase